MSKVRKHIINPNDQVIFADLNTEKIAKINLPPEPAIVILNNNTRYITYFRENGEFWTAYRLKKNQINKLIDEKNYVVYIWQHLYHIYIF